MAKSSTPEAEELQLEFLGGIIDMDKTPKPATLTKEQSRQLGELIYLRFKRWYEQ